MANVKTNKIVLYQFWARQHGLWAKFDLNITQHKTRRFFINETKFIFTNCYSTMHELNLLKHIHTQIYIHSSGVIEFAWNLSLALNYSAIQPEEVTSRDLAIFDCIQINSPVSSKNVDLFVYLRFKLNWQLISGCISLSWLGNLRGCGLAADIVVAWHVSSRGVATGVPGCAGATHSGSWHT